MTGWNMPPGCNVSDIPGNRPEDQRAEALYNDIYECLDRLELEKVLISGDRVVEVLDQLADSLFQLCGEVYQEGYNKGISDADFAHDHRALTVKEESK